MPATTIAQSLARMAAMSDEDWDKAYMRYVHNMTRAGRTHFYTREEYPRRCVEWAQEHE